MNSSPQRKAMHLEQEGKIYNLQNIIYRRSIDFAYGNQLGNIELSEDDKPSSLENEPNDREDCKQK